MYKRQVAVVEGVGDHGCEYMTGGTVLILGKTGKNFAAGMSGGIAYVLDENHDLYLRVNKELVNIDTVSEKHDIFEIKKLLADHINATGSPLGRRILDNFPDYCEKFKKIMPIDYNHMLQSISQMEEKGMSREQAEIEAFYMNTNR